MYKSISSFGYAFTITPSIRLRNFCRASLFAGCTLSGGSHRPADSSKIPAPNAACFGQQAALFGGLLRRCLCVDGDPRGTAGGDIRPSCGCRQRDCGGGPLQRRANDGRSAETGDCSQPCAGRAAESRRSEITQRRGPTKRARPVAGAASGRHVRSQLFADLH